MSNLQFEFLETSNRTMYGRTGQCPTDSFSLMFIPYFGRISLTKCPFDPILLLLAL
jgi:hypothetical protein